MVTAVGELAAVSALVLAAALLEPLEDSVSEDTELLLSAAVLVSALAAFAVASAVDLRVLVATLATFAAVVELATPT